MPWIKPRCVAVETTQDWSDEILDEAGRIWEIFIYDSNRVTHACEVTPSYECWVVGYLSQRRLNDKMHDDVEHALRTGDRASLYHTSSIDKLPQVALNNVRCVEAEYEQTFDEIVDSYRFNVLPDIPAMSGLIEEWDGDDDPPVYRQPGDLGWSTGDVEVEDLWFTGEDHLRFQHRVNLAAFYYGSPVDGETVTFRGGLFEVHWAGDCITVDALREPRNGRLYSPEQLVLEVGDAPDDPR